MSGVGAAGAGAAAAAPTTSLRPSNIALAFLALGLLGLFITSATNYILIDNGASGQFVIDDKIRNMGIAAGTFLALAIFGWAIYTMSQRAPNQYLLLWILAFSSWIVSNFALLCSLYQVQVVSK